MNKTILPNMDNPSPKIRGDWKFCALGSLSEISTPRVFTTAEFQKFLHSIRPDYASSASRKFADALVQAGAIQKVSTGLYLNKRSVPPAELVEIASRIRVGATISLHSVLGECGFLNSPTNNVMAVVPTSAQHRPTLGEVRTSGGAVFRFYGLAPRFFPISDQDRWDLLQPGRPCDMFRPEAALLQWLYLAKNQRSTLTAPPTDVDIQVLDIDRVKILASRWRLEVEFEQWHERAEGLGFAEQKHNYVDQELPKAVSSSAAEAARARVLARRKPRISSSIVGSIKIQEDHELDETNQEEQRERMRD